jgi:YVTN family beta-propeller protein
LIPGESIAQQASCSDRLYAANSFSHNVSVVDTNTFDVIETTPVGLAPGWMIFSADRKTIYVSNNWQRSISVIDVATNTVVKTIVTAAGPIGLAATPDGTRLVVSYLKGEVRIIELATGAVTPPIKVGFDPEQIRMTPDGKYVYMVSTLEGIFKLDVERGEIVDTVPVSDIADPEGSFWAQFFPLPYNIEFSPDNALLYVAATIGGFMAVIDLQTNTVLDRWKADGATAIQFSRDQSKVYVTNHWGATVDEYDLLSGEQLRSYAENVEGLSFAKLDADGKYLYYGQAYDTTMRKFDTETWQPVASVEVGIGVNSLLLCDSP